MCEYMRVVGRGVVSFMGTNMWATKSNLEYDLGCEKTLSLTQYISTYFCFLVIQLNNLVNVG